MNGHPLQQVASPSETPPAQESLELPNEQETADLLESVVALSERVQEYQEGASAIDDEYRRRNEDRRFGLDDLPYGEELIRIRDFPAQLSDAQRQLEKIQQRELSTEKIADSFHRAAEIVQDVESTLDDCSPLPLPEPDDDEIDDDDLDSHHASNGNDDFAT